MLCWEVWEELPERERATASTSSLLMCQFDWRTGHFPRGTQSVDMAAPAKIRRVCVQLQLVESLRWLEERLRHVKGGSPISLLDRISDRRSHFQAEMDPMETEIEGREVHNRSPTTRGFGDHEDPAVEAWGRKVGYLFEGLFVEDGRDLLFQGSCHRG